MGLDIGGTEVSLSLNLLQVGGGSKIKSAVTVCSLDRGEHILLELVSDTAWDLLLAWKDPAGQGCSGLHVGFYLLNSYFCNPSSFTWYVLSNLSMAVLFGLNEILWKYVEWLWHIFYVDIFACH